MAKKNGQTDPSVEPTQAAGVPTHPDDEGYEEEQVGFPAYWVPGDAGDMAQFKGIVTGYEPGDGLPKDIHEARERGLNPAVLSRVFARWIIEAQRDLECFRGPQREAESCLVAAGEFFSVSVFSGLPLERFIGMSVIVTAKDKRALPGGHTLWTWSVKVKPEDKKILADRRAELAKQMVAATKQFRGARLEVATPATFAIPATA